jgi:hypothetical protein
MAIIIEYDTLFEIRILHHYFLNSGLTHFGQMTESEKAATMLRYDSREIFDIRPTSETLRLLASCKAIFRHTATGLIAGIRSVKGENQPDKKRASLGFDTTDTFTFTVEVKDPGFRNYTALPLKTENETMFLFKNTEQDSKIEFPSLSVNPALFKNGTTYNPGDMVADQAENPQKLFIAKVRTTQNTTDADAWAVENRADEYPVHYATSADRIRVVRGILNYKEKVSGEVVRAELSMDTGGEFPVKFEAMPADANVSRVLQFDFRQLPEGIYTLNLFKADDTPSDHLVFYLLQRPAIPFAIIQIRVKSNKPDYHLTDQDNFLRSPVFTLRFRNRATHWKYTGKKFNQQSVTTEPFPLTRHGIIKNIKVKDITNSDVDDLPNPSAGMIKTDETRYYSEIHIN